MQFKQNLLISNRWHSSRIKYMTSFSIILASWSLFTTYYSGFTSHGLVQQKKHHQRYLPRKARFSIHIPSIATACLVFSSIKWGAGGAGERWFNDYKHSLLLQKTWVWFLNKPSSLQSPLSPVPDDLIPTVGITGTWSSRHTYNQNTHIHKINIFKTGTRPERLSLGPWGM